MTKATSNAGRSTALRADSRGAPSCIASFAFRPLVLEARAAIHVWEVRGLRALDAHTRRSPRLDQRLGSAIDHGNGSDCLNVLPVGAVGRACVDQLVRSTALNLARACSIAALMRTRLGLGPFPVSR